MGGTSKALLKSSTTIDGTVPGGCNPFPRVLTAGSAALTLQQARLFGIAGASFDIGIQSLSDALLTITGSSVNGFRTGLFADGNLKLTVSGSTFSSNFVGIDARKVPTGSITITGSSLLGNITGIRAPFFKLRSSKVMLNEIGILLTSPFTDLGQTYDPGNNTISGNSQTGVAFDAPIINGKVGGIFAAGNTWNAFTQGSDASGGYPGNPLLNNSSPSTTGKNFQLPQGIGFFQIQL
jgi:hypothetical protein